jgi:hypothetical protein
MAEGKLIYEPIPIDWDGKWDKIEEDINQNWKNLEECDRTARSHGWLVGRYFRIAIADGAAVYQVVGVSARRANIQLITGIGDDWQDRYYGSGGSFAREEILRRIELEPDKTILDRMAAKAKGE